MTVLAVQPDTITIKSSKCENLKQRAMIRQKRTDLRHAPNEHDICIANDNAKDLCLSQYKAIK